MEKRFIRAFMQRSEEGGAEGEVIRFTASTEEVARDGIIIEAAGWKLDNYRLNPVVLWAHDYFGRNLPIGRAEKVEILDKTLVAEVKFDQGDEFAKQIERKYRAGFLNAVSVGWNTLAIKPSKAGEAPRITEAELLDISAVPVPGDPDALMERELRGLQEILAGSHINGLNKGLKPLVGPIVGTAKSDSASMKTLQGNPTEAVWNGIASAMLALFRENTAMEEENRKAVYILLERAYGKLGRVAPEYRTQNELVGLGCEEIEGLFLEGEGRMPCAPTKGGVRKGAVLNTRNRGDLEEAVTLIQGVLKRATKEEGDGEGGEGEHSVIPMDEALETMRQLSNRINQI